MRVGLLGASGFIGQHLAERLRARGDEVASATLRDPAAAAAQLAGCHAIVNLAGEPVAQRWTRQVKERIASSRIEAPRAFMAALAQRSERPNAYISASAIGFYGSSEQSTFTEQSPPGDGFLADVCVRWEAQAQRACELGMRVALVRTGLVLAPGGGALKQLLPPFRLGLGGVVGSGRQWYSWIHIDDVVDIYVAAIDGLDGVLNATAPQPVTNAEFTRTLGAALHRPTILPVPSIALRAMLGEGADVVLLGQRVIPQRTQSLGYRFLYESLGDALRNLLG